MPRLFAALLAVNMLVPVAAAQAASERPAGPQDVAPQGGGEAAAAGGRRKPDFRQLNGYLRVRGDLFDNLDLRRDADPAGYYLFPRPLLAPQEHGTPPPGDIRFRPP